MLTKIIPFQYETTPYTHQHEEFVKFRNNKFRALFWEMGTGKTKPIIDTIAWLFLNQEIDGAFVVSDKGAYLNWELEEIPKHLPKNVPYRLAHWSSAANKKEKAALNSILVAKDDVLDILLMNVEALSTDRAKAYAQQFIANHYVMMIIDESTSIKNIKADRTKACLALGRQCEYRRIMTGTPITQSPLDLYSQCEFLQPGILGHKNFFMFRSYYAIQTTMILGTRSFQKIIGYKNLDELTRKIAPFSSRITKEECLDLPDKIYEIIYVELTPEQRFAYEQLRRMALLRFEQGQLTSTSALTLINKLHQITCGHVALDDGTIIDLPNLRVQAVINLLQKLQDKKCIIWCAFQRDVELIIHGIHEAKKQGELGEGYPVNYYGKTIASDRVLNLKKFHEDPKCQWIIGTAATGGKGLTLTEASNTIYFSNSYSLEDRLQSEDRNHRIGQNHKVTYFDLIAPGTVDKKILDALRKKEDLAHQVLDKAKELFSPIDEQQ